MHWLLPILHFFWIDAETELPWIQNSFARCFLLLDPEILPLLDEQVFLFASTTWNFDLAILQTFNFMGAAFSTWCQVLSFSRRFRHKVKVSTRCVIFLLLALRDSKLAHLLQHQHWIETACVKGIIYSQILVGLASESRVGFWGNWSFLTLLFCCGVCGVNLMWLNGRNHGYNVTILGCDYTKLSC